MSKPVNNRNFGGVNFNWNQVKSAKVTKHKDGKETYFIEFKTGVTAEFPLQNGGTMTSVSREYSLVDFLSDVVSRNDIYDTETKVAHIKGATIKGTSKDDHIVADSIKDCTIDVSGDNNDDQVDIKGDVYETHFQGGAGAIKLVRNEVSDGNRIILGKQDKVTNIYEDNLLKDMPNGDSIISQREMNQTTVKGPGVENRF